MLTFQKWDSSKAPTRVCSECVNNRNPEIVIYLSLFLSRGLVLLRNNHRVRLRENPAAISYGTLSCFAVRSGDRDRASAPVCRYAHRPCECARCCSVADCASAPVPRICVSPLRDNAVVLKLSSPFRHRFLFG